MSKYLTMAYAVGLLCGAAIGGIALSTWRAGTTHAPREDYFEKYIALMNKEDTAVGRVKDLEHRERIRRITAGLPIIEQNAVVVFPNAANAQVIGETDAAFGAACNPPDYYYVCLDSYRHTFLYSDDDIKAAKGRVVYRGQGALPALKQQDVWGPHRPRVDDADLTRLNSRATEK